MTYGAAPPTVIAEAIGGTGGAVGDRGDAGAPGLGGAPGNNCFTDTSGGPNNPNFGMQTCGPSAHNGPAGPPGQPGPIKNSGGNPGKTQVPSLNVGTTEDVASHLAITQLKMTLHRCELDFLNNQTDLLADRLKWMIDISTSKQPGLTYYTERQKRLGSSEVGLPVYDEWTALANRCSILLDRFAFNLDAYGFAANYVSPLSPDFLKTAQVRFDIADAIEKANNKYFDQKAKLDDKKNALLASLDKVNASVDVIKQDTLKSEDDANQAQDNIASLTATMEELKRQITVAQQKFQNAVGNKAQCEIGKLIEFVAGVIAIAYGFYAGYLAIANTFATLNNPNTFAGATGLISQLKIIGDTFDKSKITQYFDQMKKGFQEVQGALKDDSAKIVVSQEAFESQLQPFMDLPEAIDYRDLMRQLVDTAQSRNQVLLAYTQYVMKTAMGQAEQQSLQLEGERIGRLIAATNNPALTECVLYLSSHLAFAKRSILELSELQRRSLMYAILKPIHPKYNDAVVAALKVSQIQYNEVWVDSLDAKGREEEIFDATFVIDRKTNPGFFNVLAKRGEAVFAIPFDHPDFNRGGTSFVTVQQVDMTVDGIQTATGKYTCRLSHLGNSNLADQNGERFNFNHKKRITILSYELKSGQWTPTFNKSDNLAEAWRDICLYLRLRAGIYGFRPMIARPSIISEE